MLVLIRGVMENLVGLWGGGALIACFLARWNRVPPVIVTKLPAEERGQQFLYGVEKVFSLYGPRGVVKNLK